MDERLARGEAQRQAREQAIALQQLEWWATHRDGVVASWTTAQLEANDVGAAIDAVPIYSTGTPYFAEAEVAEELDLLPDVAMGRISGRIPPAADVLDEASPGFENAARGVWTSGTARGSFTLRINQAGGKLYTSRGVITIDDYAPLVDEALSRGETVNILSGVHGQPTGRTTGALQFKLEDVARFNKQGVVIWNFDSMTTSQITQVLNSDETIIAGFCYGALCLRPYMFP